MKNLKEMTTEVRKGQIVTLKPEWLDPGETNIPHVALEDAIDGTVKVRAVPDFPNLPIKPINVWRLAWIAL